MQKKKKEGRKLPLYFLVPALLFFFDVAAELLLKTGNYNMQNTPLPKLRMNAEGPSPLGHMWHKFDWNTADAYVLSYGVTETPGILGVV